MYAGEPGRNPVTAAGFRSFIRAWRFFFSSLVVLSSEAFDCMWNEQLEISHVLFLVIFRTLANGGAESLLVLVPVFRQRNLFLT